MIAHLGMYDMPHTRAAHDAFWRHIREALGFGPSTLSRDGDAWQIWRAPDLLLSQTCGLPFRAKLSDQVQLVATPDYGLPGCAPGLYNSVIVVRADAPAQNLGDLKNRTLAYNDPLSQSGWAAPYAELGDAGVPFVAALETGAHVNSARAVAQGHADFAALDALTWSMLQHSDPALTGQLRALARTTPTPALPYITALGRDPAPLADALGHAIAALEPDHRATLHLNGVVRFQPADYLALPVPPLP